MQTDPKADYFVLRAEWLKYKTNLFDKNTNLPTLPIVVDDARKLIEEYGNLGLLLIDLGKQKNFEATYGWQLYDQVIRQFAEILEECKRELLQEKDIVTVSHVRGDEFIIFLSPQHGQPWTEPALDLINERVRNGVRRKM
jgi:GGDEF domain-containing protein